MKYKDIRNDFGFWSVWVTNVIMIYEIFTYLSRHVAESNLWRILFLILAMLPVLGLLIFQALIDWKKDSSGNYIANASRRRASLIVLVIGVLVIGFSIIYGSMRICG